MKSKEGGNYETNKRRLYHAGYCGSAELNYPSSFSMESIPWMITGTAAMKAKKEGGTFMKLDQKIIQITILLLAIACICNSIAIMR